MSIPSLVFMLLRKFARRGGALYASPSQWRVKGGQKSGKTSLIGLIGVDAHAVHHVEQRRQKRRCNTRAEGVTAGQQ